MASGTGGRAKIGGYDIAGKTGTTSDYKDAWFIGYTGGFVTAVWVGKDDNTPMRKITGGGPPAELWRSFMSQALPRLKVQAIPTGAMAPDTNYADPIGELLSGNTTPSAVPAAGETPSPQGPQGRLDPPAGGRDPSAAPVASGHVS